MATVAVSRTERDSLWQRLLHASLAGPEMGAVLLVVGVFVTHANFRYANAEQAGLDWQIMLRLAVCALCGAYGLAHFQQVIGVLTRFPFAWCTLYLGWATLTVPFAVNPQFALAAAVTLWCSVVFVPAALSQLGGRNILIVMLVAISTYVTISWSVYIFIPSVGRTAFVYDEIVYRLGGLGHPNDTGLMGALGCALLFILRSAGAVRWRYFWPLLAMFVATLVYAESRTAMIVAAIAGAICLLRSRPTLFVVGGLAAVTVLLAATLLSSNSSAGLLALLPRSGDAEEIYELTGRTYVWEFVMGKIRETPIMGAGYNCARFVMIEYNAGRDEFSGVYHPHNLLLNVVLGNGLPGGLLFLGMIGSQVIAFFRRPSLYPDVVLAIILFGGITEVIIFYPIPGASTLLWLIALCWRSMGASLDGGIPSLPQQGRVI